MLNLNWDIIWTFVNLIVFYLLLKKFLFGPVNAMMEKRANEIEGSIESAKNVNIEAAQLKSEYEEALKNAKMEATEIKREAQIRVQEEHDIAIKVAEEEAKKVMLVANKAIEIERAKSIQSIQSEISGIAINAASKLIQRNMNEDINKDFMDEFLLKAGALE